LKTIILCGGKGQRMTSPNEDMPKPMAMVNGKPLLHHIMKIYSKYGYNDFILPLGYKGDKIKEYFMNFEWKNSDFIKTTNENNIQMFDDIDKFKITFINTGISTMTGARIKRVSKYIDTDQFMITYGDGLANINIDELIDFHNKKGKICTVIGVQKKSQYGILGIENDIAISFNEKESIDGIINGGFFVCNKEFLDYLSDDEGCVLEQEPLRKLIADKQLAVYSHNDIWMSVDTYKDLQNANEIWKE